MKKRIMHCAATAIVCAVIAVLLALTMPRKADAMPIAWRFTRTTTHNGVTYRVRDGDHVAVVIRTSRRNVTIPAEVKAFGKWYEVKAIWDGSLRGVKKVTIHADLETCEDARLWKIPVRVTRRGMYRWLRKTGANVRKVYCKHCK